MSLEQLLAAASEWLEQDPDPATRAELRELIEKRNQAALRDRFDSRLNFGTAGLRGELGAGPNRMNRVLVAQAAAGIAAWLRENSESITPSVLIGFDARVNSKTFAYDSAAIFSAAGIRATVFEQATATPILAFGVKEFGFSLGIMVTASHNPPRDNGYKVYLGGSGGGAQIVAPIDSQMAQKIAEVADSQTFAEIAKTDIFQVGGQEVTDRYIEATAALVGTPTPSNLKVVYTAMHGVGWSTTRALFARVGLPEPIGVTQQLEPDGSFPTLSFPNPEEPGALDLAMARANEVGADLIIANDPDADRLGVALPDQSAATGWRRLSGDEVGLLLAHELAERATGGGTLANTIVSSSALQAVAKTHKLDFVQTLTGFKHLARVPNLIFAYEEALGYSVNPARVPDKDGISAALLLVDLANRLAATGTTLAEHLEQLAERYGHFATSQISLRFDNVKTSKKLIQQLRKNPPTQLDDVDCEVVDLLKAGGELPSTDALKIDLADGRRVIVRPSGTEPKLKCYLQASGKSSSAAGKKLKKLEAAVTALLQV